MQQKANSTHLFNNSNNLLSSKDLTPELIRKIIRRADELEPFANELKKTVREKRPFDEELLDRMESLRGRFIFSMFGSPSTRTKASFWIAMHNLGGSVMDIELSKSSGAKGESIEDTRKVLEGYSSKAVAIIIRHESGELIGGLAEGSELPVINAGDGGNEHPTQSLVDLFSFMKEYKSLDNLRIAVAGDLRYGRAVHSLIYALSLFNGNQVIAIAPNRLQLPHQIISDPSLSKNGFHLILEDSLEKAIGCDGIYMSRLQAERIPKYGLKTLRRLYMELRLNKEFVIEASQSSKREFKIFHPLPRPKGKLCEIPVELDSLTNNAVYFWQAWRGVAVRMALLEHIAAPPRK